MSDEKSNQLNWSEILGLRDFRDGTTALVRAAQLRELSQQSALPLIAIGMGVALIAWWFAAFVPPMLLAGWCAAFGGIALAVVASNRHHLILKEAARRQDLFRAIGNCIAIGLFWAVPPIFFASYGGEIGAVMIAASALVVISSAGALLTVLPLGGLAIIAITGASIAIMLAKIGHPGLAGIASIYAICLVYGLLANGRAVIERMRDQIALNEKEQVLNLLLRQGEAGENDWIWQIDANKHIVEPSTRFATAAGVDAKILAGMPLMQLFAGPRWQSQSITAEARRLLEALQKGRTFSDLAIPYARDGQNRWWQISGVPLLNSSQRITGYRGVIADITERRASDRRNHHMAHYDALTGLPNRSYTNELLQQSVANALENGKGCAFLMIDLDRFKAVNDTLGHPVGDKLLEQVAARLGTLMGKNDIAGRLGGDEFAAVIADLGYGDDLDRRATRIINLISQPYQVDTHMLHIGASIGSAMCPKDGRSAPALMRHADLALYRAKDNGRGIHERYEPALSRRAEQRREIETALRKAVEQGEFTLAYQPIISLADREIAGFEALLRWENESLGSVSPATFLPIAEETRLIDPIGEWVIRQACADAASWPARYRLGINLSEGQLRNANLATVILSAVTQAGLDPKRLEVETTETVLRKGNELAIETFGQLNAMGITVGLDDFGTGHSTLRYIGESRFNSIKIDNDFIRNAQQDCKASIAVFKAVVAMANSLNIATIAEGVENEEQFELAEALGCSQVQGYFLDRPMNAEAVAGLLRTDTAAVA